MKISVIEVYVNGIIKTGSVFSVEKCYREKIAVDETKLKINGHLHILWAAIDTCNWEVLGVWVYKRSWINRGIQFVKIRVKLSALIN